MGRDTPSLCHYLPLTRTLCCQQVSPPEGNTAALLHEKRNTWASSETLKLSIWTECFQGGVGALTGMLSGAVSPVSGLISSSSFTMPSPCMRVQCLMGEPPPILLYCSWIFGVRRLAMNGPSLLQSQGQINIVYKCCRRNSSKDNINSQIVLQ